MRQQVEQETQPIAPGIYSPEELSNEAYHDDPAVGSSGLKLFSECPALYHYHYIDPVGREERKQNNSNHQSLGSHAHVALLEPERFRAEYEIAPQMAVVNYGKKNQKTVPMNKAHGDWKEFAADTEAKGKSPLLWSEFETCKRMMEAIQRHDLANAVLSQGKAEMSFFAKCPKSGEMIKSRPDKLRKLANYGNLMVDYKTTGLALDSSSQSSNAFNMGRHIQAAIHKAGVELATGGKIDHVIYIVQSQQAPFLIRAFRMPEDCIQYGADIAEAELLKLAECRRTGVWPEYSQEIEDLIMPKWMDYEFN